MLLELSQGYQYRPSQWRSGMSLQGTIYHWCFCTEMEGSTPPLRRALAHKSCMCWIYINDSVIIKNHDFPYSHGYETRYGVPSCSGGSKENETMKTFWNVWWSKVLRQAALNGSIGRQLRSNEYGMYMNSTLQTHRNFPWKWVEQPGGRCHEGSTCQQGQNNRDRSGRGSTVSQIFVPTHKP